jgi:hypothetical protein
MVMPNNIRYLDNNTWTGRRGRRCKGRNLLPLMYEIEYSSLLAVDNSCVFKTTSDVY